MPTRTRRRRFYAPEFDRGQLAWLRGEDDVDVSGECSVMEFNRFCWLTTHASGDPERRLPDGSPGPAELIRIAKSAGIEVAENLLRSGRSGQSSPAR